MIQRLTRSTDDAGLTAAPMGEQELMMDTAEGERLRRWRLVLGEEAQASFGLAGLSPEDRQMDEALAALYEADSRHSLRGGSGASSPRVARWLGDIRRFFPSSVVQVMQKDAFERLNLHSMLLQPEMLESVQPDVNLVSTLMSLRGIIPEKTKETARLVVRKVVDALMKQLEEPMRTAVSGALNRAVRNRRPRHAEIDWNRTIDLQTGTRSRLRQRNVGRAGHLRRVAPWCADQHDAHDHGLHLRRRLDQAPHRRPLGGRGAPHHCLGPYHSRFRSSGGLFLFPFKRCGVRLVCSIISMEIYCLIK